VRSEDGRPMEPSAPAGPRDFNAADTIATGLTMLEFDVLGIYPNPFSDILLLDVHRFAMGDLLIQLFDSGGSEVFSQNHNAMPRGRMMIRLDRLALSSGRYELRLISGNNMLTRTVVCSGK